MLLKGSVGTSPGSTPIRNPGTHRNYTTENRPASTLSRSPRAHMYNNLHTKVLRLNQYRTDNSHNHWVLPQGLIRTARPTSNLSNTQVTAARKREVPNYLRFSRYRSAVRVDPLPPNPHLVSLPNNNSNRFNLSRSHNPRFNPSLNLNPRFSHSRRSNLNHSLKYRRNRRSNRNRRFNLSLRSRYNLSPRLVYRNHNVAQRCCLSYSHSN